MANYELDFTVACKTGSTDYDNLIVAYTPDILITGWTGYDDNRKIENTEEKTFLKEITVEFLKYKQKMKKNSWYKPSQNLMSIAINPLSGENDENGVVYWFKKED